jgi:hypothetical protein
MARKSENHQPSLFDEETPRVEPSAAQRVELAALVEALLREIAETLVDAKHGESVHDQDHV